MRGLNIKEKNTSVFLQKNDKLVKVVTSKGCYDWVKQKMLDYYVKKGYIVCLAEEKN